MRPCGRDLFELIPKNSVRLDLGKTSRILKKIGYEILDESDMVLTAKGKCDLSIYPNGKMLVHPFKSNKEAESMGGEILAILCDEKGCVINQN